MTESEKLKNTLSAIFERKGCDGRYTRLFDNLESAQKDALLKEVQLSEGELPVIGSAESQEKWLLVTTGRIVWRLGGKAQTLPVEAVRDVVADFQKLVVTGRKKDQMKELQILATSGEQYTVEVEEGAPLMGVWNALKNLGVRNRQAK
jgi:hypothetical protein